MSNPDPLGGPDQWRAERRAARAQRRAARWRSGRWGGVPLGGAIILLLGVILLAGNFGYVVPPRWWAVLLLIPAVALIVTAIRFYRAAPNFRGRVMGPAIGGVLLLALALALFFDISMAVLWPVVLIVIGAAILARNFWR